MKLILFLLLLFTASDSLAVEAMRLQQSDTRSFALAPYMERHPAADTDYIFAIENATEAPLTLYLTRWQTSNPLAKYARTPLRLLSSLGEEFAPAADAPNILSFTIAPKSVRSFLLLDITNPEHIYIFSPEYFETFNSQQDFLHRAAIFILSSLLSLTIIFACARRKYDALFLCLIAAAVALLLVRVWQLHPAISLPIWGCAALLAAARLIDLFRTHQPLLILDASLIAAATAYYASANGWGDSIQIYAFGNLTLAAGASLLCLQAIFSQRKMREKKKKRKR